MPLWLSEEDVQELLTLEGALHAVRSAFLAHGNRQTQMPSKVYLQFPKYEGDLRTMPAYIEPLGMAGVKIVNSHPKNPQIGLPAVQALLVLNA